MEEDYYFNISKNSNTLQIQIFPGDYAIPILLGGEPTIPDISKAEFFGSFDDSDFKKLLDQGLEIPEEELNMLIPLKKPKKVGRNLPDLILLCSPIFIITALFRTEGYKH